jgi:hypothetical protein
LPPGAGSVVAVTAPDGAEVLPAASRAVTVKVYAVAAASPPTVKVVPDVLPTTVPARRTWYPVTPTLSVDADQESETLPDVCPVTVRFAGALGGWVSDVDDPYTSNSDSCPAAQPVLAVMFSRRYRAVVDSATVTVLPAAGSKVYPADPTTVANVDPSVLPSTERVWVRVPQPDGSFSTSRLTATTAPRSTCIHCGKTLLTLSQ